MQLIIDDACLQVIPGSVIRNGMFFVKVSHFFNSHRIGIRFIKTCAWNTALYGCETWKTTKKDREIGGISNVVMEVNG